LQISAFNAMHVRKLQDSLTSLAFLCWNKATDRIILPNASQLSVLHIFPCRMSQTFSVSLGISLFKVYTILYNLQSMH